MVSLWKAFKFKAAESFSDEKRKKLADMAALALLTGEEGIHERFINGPEAEAALKISEATAKLIESIRDLEEVIIRAGPILIVKANQNGKVKLAAQTMSVRLRRILDENPRLMDSPSLLLVELQKKLETPTQELPPASDLVR